MTRPMTQMAEVREPPYTLVARVCETCESWPCRCVRTESTGQPRRRVRCRCGLWIESPTMLDTDIADAVARHNVEPVHERWREENAL